MCVFWHRSWYQQCIWCQTAITLLVADGLPYKLQDASMRSCCYCCLSMPIGHGVAARSFCAVYSPRGLDIDTSYCAAVAKQRNAKNSYGLVSASFPLAFLEKSPRPPRALTLQSRAVASETERFVLVKWVQTRLAIGGEVLV